MHFSNIFAAAGLLAVGSAQLQLVDELLQRLPHRGSHTTRSLQPSKAIEPAKGVEPSKVAAPSTPSTPVKGANPVVPVKGASSVQGSAPSAAPSGGVVAPGKATDGTCPPVWTDISKELTSMFRDGVGCNDNARAIIRGVFHDCFPAGGCDGSLSIPEELSRSENSPMTSTINALKSLAVKHKVGVADMLMFAGSHAVITCPGGPTTKTFIGRVDAKSPAPTGQLPTANVSAAEAKSHFASKGFTSQDLAALVGAHTASRQFNTDLSKVGASQDSTPGIWDLLFYVQIIAKIAPFTFQSDINLLADADTGKYMRQFSTNKGGWDAAFAPAFAKMQVLGAEFTKVDCTSALPKGMFKRSAGPNYSRSVINSLALRRSPQGYHGVAAA